MARILFTVWPFAGHIYPSLAVAAPLAARGHEIGFYTGADGAVRAERAGYRAFPFEAIDESRLYDTMFQRDHLLDSARHPRRSLDVLRAWLIETIEPQLQDLSAVLQEWRPDVIVTDPGMWAPITVLQEREAIPVAVLAYVTGAMIPGPELPIFGLGLPQMGGWSRRWLGQGIKWATDRLLAGSRDEVNQIRRRHRLPPIDVPVSEYAGRMPLYLVTSSPALDYNRKDLPASVHYVGPCLPDGSHLELPAWIEALPTSEPWILVSEGTLHTQRPFVLQAAAEGLAGLPMQVIMTTGGDRDPDSLGLGPLAPNIHVDRFVPYAKLLPKIDVMVTTGGAGTVLYALDAGVPQVVIPTEWDKLENAQRVADARAGIRLAPRRVSAASLRAAVQKVLDGPAYLAGAGRIAGSFRRCGGPEQAATLIEGLVAAPIDDRAEVAPAGVA